MAIEELHTPSMPRFDQFDFGEDSSGRVDVDISHLRGKPPLVVQISAYESDHLIYGWYGALLHQHDYRLASVFPQKQAPRQPGNAAAASLARGIAALLAKADKYGFDPQHVILTGSGVGGDLAALLATDPTYFQRAGVPFAAIKTVVVFDATGFDLNAYLATVSRYGRGENQAAKTNSPAFLFEMVKHDKEREAKAEAMVAALTQAGSQARIERYDRPIPYDRSTDFGYPTNPDNAGLLRFLGATVGRP